MPNYHSSFKRKSYKWKDLNRHERKRWHRNNLSSGGNLNKNNITWKDLK